MKPKSRKSLERELKILRATRKTRGRLPPGDAERLAWLENHLEGAATPPGEDEDTSKRNDPRRQVSMDDLFTDEALKKEPSMTGSVPIDLATGAGAEGRGANLPNNPRGPRQAIIHDLSGIKRQGMIAAVDIDAEIIHLEAAAGVEASARDLDTGKLESVYVMLPKGMAPPKKEGRAVRVRFRSGKELKGLTPDCDPGHRAFTVFPDGDRYVERVIVFYRKDLEVFFEGDRSP